MIVIGGLYRPDDFSPSPAFASYLGMSLSSQMEYLRTVISEGRRVRGIKMRQPLSSATVFTKQPYVLDRFDRDMRQEWNVRTVYLIDMRCLTDDLSREDCVEFDHTLTAELVDEGWLAELKRRLQNRRKELGLSMDDLVPANFSPHSVIDRNRGVICDDVHLVMDDTVTLSDELMVEGEVVRFGFRHKETQK